MRLFAFFFLLSSALGVALPLPAFAAQDKKELSEEEEIALMMEQLEQFKASWENKGQAAKVAAPGTSAQPSTEKPLAESKPALIVPTVLTPPVTPSIKITTIQAPATGPVQIKTQDGRIPGTSASAVKSDIKPGIQIMPVLAPPLVKQPEILKAPLEKTVEIKAAVVQAVPALQEKKSERRVTKADFKLINQELIKKLNLPVKPEPAAPSEVLKKAAEPAAQPKPEIKAVPAVQEKKLEQKIPTAEPQFTNQEIIKKLNIPPKPEAVAPPAVLEKMEALPIKAKQAPAAEKIAVPTVEAQSVKPDSAGKTAEPGQDQIVIVQDEAAQYRVAREDTQLKSARESVQASSQRGLPAAADSKGGEAQVIVDSDDAKVLDRRQGVSLPGDLRAQTRSKWAVARGGGPIKKEPPKPNLFAETFYLNSDQRLAYDVYDIDGFIFVKAPNPDLNTKYAVVTGFGGGAMKTRSISNLQTLDEAKKWVSDNLTTEKFENVEIKKISLGKDSHAKDLYWVGQKAYPDLKMAQQEVAVVQSVVTAQGGDFAQLVSEASTYAPMTDGTQGAEIKGPANFEREEELMLKYLDQLDIGEKLFGPFQGDPSGESFTWQSFGETTWRKTNLDRTDYKSQVGFWTNRVVFKGFRFPMNTVDAFLESTVSLDSTSADFASNMKLFAGLEWRPFARNPWLYNYRPWGGINVLEWIKNYRFYVMYGDRKNIKDPIDGSADHDLITGVQIFYEWGVELPPLDQADPKAVSDFVERYFWGEYFGDYRHEMTNFGSEDDYNSWLLNSSITLGVKIPGIPLPENPINEELMLMPYMRFEHVNSTEFSFPYQNQYFVAAGMRWMPFRNYRFKENEWLSKTKLFGEYVGVGLTQHAKQDGEAPNAVRWDLRFGVSFSSRRY